jgi:hypothetical protein
MQQPNLSQFPPEEWHAYAMSMFATPIPRATSERGIAVESTVSTSTSIIASTARQPCRVRTNAPAEIRYICSKLKRGSSPGPDGIPPEFLIHAHPILSTVLATFSFDAESACFFPSTVMASDLLYLYKSGKKLPRASTNSYRPIRCSSVVGKVIERGLTTPFNPLGGDEPDWFSPSQFAGRKGHGADALAFILSMIIHFTQPNPIFLILVDVSKAFDRTWKDALYHKLLLKGVPPRLLASISALYSHLSSRIKHGMSGFFNCVSGIAQGSTNSPHFFTSFMNDLPERLSSPNVGVHLLDIYIACLLFLDDVVIPVSSFVNIAPILKTLEDYGVDWKISYSLPKCAVLTVRAPLEYATWDFAGGKIST